MRWIKPVTITLVILIGLWTVYWFGLAYGAQKMIARAMTSTDGQVKISSPYTPDIDGFPGALVLTWPQVHFETPNLVIDAGALELRVWPLPGAPATLFAADGIVINRPQVQQTVDMDSLSLDIRLPLTSMAITVKAASLVRSASVLEAVGDVVVPFDPRAPIAGLMNARATGYGDLVDYLVSQDMVDERDAGMAKGFLDAMAATQGTPGRITVSLNVKDSWLYVGPVRAFNLRPEPVPQPTITPVPGPADESGLPPLQTHPADSGSISPLDLNPQIESSGP